MREQGAVGEGGGGGVPRSIRRTGDPSFNNQDVLCGSVWRGRSVCSVWPETALEAAPRVSLSRGKELLLLVYFRFPSYYSQSVWVTWRCSCGGCGGGGSSLLERASRSVEEWRRACSVRVRSSRWRGGGGQRTMGRDVGVLGGWNAIAAQPTVLVHGTRTVGGRGTPAQRKARAAQRSAAWRSAAQRQAGRTGCGAGPTRNGFGYYTG